MVAESGLRSACMTLRHFSLAAILAATATLACAQNVPPTPPPYVPPPFATSGDAAFDAWRARFAADAVNVHRLPAAIVERELAALVPDPTVARLNARQPEFVRPVWDYLASAVSQARITRGRAAVSRERAVLAPLEASTGVPVEVAIAIWAMESNFGDGKGSMDVVRSLASLAYQGRRTELGNRELVGALRIIERGEATRATMVGSWAGAMGHTQFIPTSFLELAVDGDGDGRRDIWNDEFDALASTMNYLSRRGWQAGEPWGAQVSVPEDIDWALIDGQKRPVAFWQQAGLRVLGETALPETMQARLLVPAGAGGPAFLVGGSYEAILDYNNSDSYALAVSFLSDRFAGRTPMTGSWPTENPPLGGAPARELQGYLNALGFDVGEPDGVIGRRTRGQLQAFQRSRGMIADGYASQAALQALRDALVAETPDAARTPLRAPEPPPGTVPLPPSPSVPPMRPRQTPTPVRVF
jgi:membrane-bound lytic murein transglycosylase B